MSEQITDERLAELEAAFQFGALNDSPGKAQRLHEDTAAALRELQQLRASHREIICRQCGLREQLGQVGPAEF